MNTNKTNNTAILDIKVLNTEGIKSAELLAEVAKLDAIEIQLRKAGKTFEAERAIATRKQAEVLDRVLRGKLYEKDGFKNIKEFADSIGMSGGKSAASQLAKSGNVYNDKKAPKALSELPPYVLCELPTSDTELRKAIYEEAEKNPDKFKGMSQSAAREYRAELKSTQPQKGKPVATFYALLNGEPIMDEYGQRISDIPDGWKVTLDGYGSECIKLPNGKYKPEDSKPLMPRFVVIAEGKAELVCLFPTEPNRKNGEVKTATVTVNQIADIKRLTKLILTNQTLSEKDKALAEQYGLLDD